MMIREALTNGTAALTTAGIESAALDAGLLLAEVLTISRSSLLAADSQSLTEEQLVAFNAFIRRRQDGECTAYILGRKEFYGLEFIVNRTVLVPRPDTETLVEIALKKLKNGEKPVRLLDLCTGSGAVAIALKHAMPELEVWASDISAGALEVAQANARRLLPAGSINFCRGDLFDAFHRSPFTVHCMVSNPPYIPTAEIVALRPEVRTEPALALDGGNDGLDIIKKIISRARRFLSPEGALLLEVDPRQMERVALLLEQSGFKDIQIHKDLSGADRVIEGVSE